MNPLTLHCGQVELRIEADGDLVSVRALLAGRPVALLHVHTDDAHALAGVQSGDGGNYVLLARPGRPTLLDHHDAAGRHETTLELVRA